MQTVGEDLFPARRLRKFDDSGDGTSEYRLGEQLRGEIAIQEKAIAAANEMIRLYAPDGDDTDVNALPKETRDVLLQAYKTRRGAVAKIAALHEQRSSLLHVAPPEMLAKRADVVDAVQALAFAKSRFEDARDGKLGRLSNNEQKAIRVAYTRAEMVFNETRAQR